MKQSLQLKLGQQLTMTPQLQQAIRLLQLSTLDLQQEIQQALESNPMLEQGDEGIEENLDSDAAADIVETAGEAEFEDPAALADSDANWDDGSLPSELPVDTQWMTCCPQPPPHRHLMVTCLKANSIFMEQAGSHYTTAFGGS